jgi:CMP-N,N'-diacetyllegionaminic acid synthase
MYKRKTYLAIIPARGGSKRLPRKNALNLNGKPLVAWSIEAGLKSKYIDKVVVTSDDSEILEIAKQYKADTIQRPIELSNDTATTFDAIKHTIDNCETYDYIVLLQATSPLRNEKHIDEAIELLQSSNSDAVVSVCEAEHSPLWSNKLPPDSDLSNFLDYSIVNKRSQDLDQYYRLNGAIYLCLTRRLSEEKTLFIKDKIVAYRMPQEQSVDIDSEVDLCLASCLINKQSKQYEN